MTDWGSDPKDQTMSAIPLALFALLLPQEPNTPDLTTQATAPVAQAEVQSTRPAQTPQPWGFEESDLAPSERIRFFNLENGIRVAWANNSEPKERVYVRLHVNVGSLAETESERGMAHFLEHMAFNGSTNFEAGTLVQWFQQHGMSFGADTNAHTAFSETVYKLDLPNNSKQSVTEGLQVLRDFASELFIAEQEVQSEKGVIDGEERERDSAGFRALVTLLEKQYAGTRMPLRLPIGTKKARDAFNAKTVRTFYETWYRPENMTLVIVGDLGDLKIEELARAAFADMQSPGTPVLAEPAMGKPTLEQPSFVVRDTEIPYTQMVISNLLPYTKLPDTQAHRRDNLTLAVASAMLDLRFQEALKDPETHFLGARLTRSGRTQNLRRRQAHRGVQARGLGYGFAGSPIAGAQRQGIWFRQSRIGGGAR